jgi:hypothetical protein
MWIRAGIANWSYQADDITMFLLLAEKLLVAYLAFGAGPTVAFLAG